MLLAVSSSRLCHYGALMKLNRAFTIEFHEYFKSVTIRRRVLRGHRHLILKRSEQSETYNK